MGKTRGEREANQIYELLGWHPRCNERCAYDIHNEISWVVGPERHTPDALRLGFTTALLDESGVEYLYHEPAPDAPRHLANEDGHYTGSQVNLQQIKDASITVATVESFDPASESNTSVAFRVTFRSPHPINQMRKAVIAELPGAAEKLIVDERDTVW